MLPHEISLHQTPYPLFASHPYLCWQFATVNIVLLRIIAPPVLPILQQPGEGEEAGEGAGEEAGEVAGEVVPDYH